MTRVLGSTNILTPLDSNTLSYLLGLDSEERGEYMKPEQPPALTEMRIPASGLLGWFRASICFKRTAAFSVTVIFWRIIIVERLSAAAGRSGIGVFNRNPVVSFVKINFCSVDITDTDRINK